MHTQMPIWDHLDELRERVLVGALAAGVAILTCFCFSKVGPHRGGALRWPQPRQGWSSDSGLGTCTAASQRA